MLDSEYFTATNMGASSASSLDQEKLLGIINELRDIERRRNNVEIKYGKLIEYEDPDKIYVLDRKYLQFPLSLHPFEKRYVALLPYPEDIGL